MDSFQPVFFSIKEISFGSKRMRSYIDSAFSHPDIDSGFKTCRPPVCLHKPNGSMYFSGFLTYPYGFNPPLSPMGSGQRISPECESYRQLCM